MITKQELNDKIESMNESLKKKDEQILKMEIEIENLKYKLKTKKGYDADIEKIREKERKNLKYNNNELENINKDLSEENKKLQNELDYYKFEKNIRGAGRKPKTTPEQIENVQKLKSEGMSYAKIAKEVGLSVGTVFNILKGKH